MNIIFTGLILNETVRECVALINVNTKISTNAFINFFFFQKKVVCINNYLFIIYILLSFFSNV